MKEELCANVVSGWVEFANVVSGWVFLECERGRLAAGGVKFDINWLGLGQCLWLSVMSVMFVG